MAGSDYVHLVELKDHQYKAVLLNGDILLRYAGDSPEGGETPESVEIVAHNLATSLKADLYRFNPERMAEHLEGAHSSEVDIFTVKVVHKLIEVLKEKAQEALMEDMERPTLLN